MALYQVKRQIRNRLVPRVPGLYAQWIRRSALRLPPPHPGYSLPDDVSDLVGAYYRVDASTARAAAAGKFSFFGRTVDFGSISGIDWTHRLPEERDHHLWRMKLGQVEVAHSLIASGDPKLQDSARTLLQHLSVFPFSSTEAFLTVWAPYVVSHRLLSTLSGMAVAYDAGNLNPDVGKDIASLARFDAALLWKNLEHDLLNNHTERNLAALCLYHLGAGKITSRQAYRLDRDVYRLICATILDDGTQVERSAMYQGLTVMSLRIFSAADFLSQRTRNLANQRGAAAEAAWLFLSHDDGGPCLFNDSWAHEVPSAADTVVAETPEALRSGGYLRTRAEHVAVVMDVGPIGPRWNPGHGHADFLATEIDSHGRRLIVDPGTSQYSTGEQRAYERSAASHNGPCFSDLEPVEYAGCFKVGKMSTARSLASDELEGLPRGAIGGLVDLGTRQVGRIIFPLGGQVVIVDRWSPAPVGVAQARFLIPEKWQVERLSHDQYEFSMEKASAQISVWRGGFSEPQAAQWSQRFMIREAALALTVTPEFLDNGCHVSVVAIGSPPKTHKDEQPRAAASAALEQLRLVLDLGAENGLS